MMKYLKLRQKIKDLTLVNQQIRDTNSANSIYMCSITQENDKLKLQLKEANEKLVILTSILPEEILKERLKP